MSKKSKDPILVPVDFSPASEEALCLGAKMAACLGAPLAIVHVVHDPGDAPGYYHVKGYKKQLRRMEDVAAEMLEEFIARIAAEHSELSSIERAERFVVVGLPVTRILQLVGKIGPAMVVMGSTGRTGLSRMMLGSKAEQVVRMCPVPVTIVRAGEEE